MAESGSAPLANFKLATTPSLSTHSTPPAVPRIRFPNHFLAAAAHGESSPSSTGSPAFPATPINPDSKNTVELGDGERPLSMEVTPVFHGTSPSKRMSPRSADIRRRSKRDKHGKSSSALQDPFVAEFEPSAFSDEYDLSHEDPKILQDVQRALDLQSRRRDRKSFTPSQPAVAECQTLIQNTTTFQLSSPVPGSPLSFVQRSRIPSDIDFSPSVQAAPPHPVPISSNGGATLDWTGSQSEEEKQERRWSLSKRKSKERPSSSNITIFEKQDTLFADRIARIRSEAKPPTFRKAAIVSDQLGRRYNIVYNSISNGDPVNLVKAARWYANSEPNTQAWLDSAEPFTWLKHLLDKRGGKRSKWHSSALIIEEYIKSNRPDSNLPVIRDDSASAQAGSLPSSVSLTLPSNHRHPIRSTTSLHLPFGDSPGRIRSSDGHVSFEPRIDSAGSSVDGDHKNADVTSRNWRHNLSVLVDPHSIVSTSSPYPRQNSPGGLSPASSLIRIPEFVHRIRRRQVESDDGSSSAINSQSEDYNGLPIGLAGRRRKRGARRQLHASPSALQSPYGSGTEMNAPGETSDIHDATPAPVGDALPSRPASELDIELPPQKPESEIPSTAPRVIPRHRLIHRTSLPVTDIAEREERKRHDAAKEEELEHKYEIKSQMLDDMKAQNHRLRQKLQKIAQEVREYELLQARLAQTRDIPHQGLPQELLEAFSHDPSSVTGGIRGQSGWRAVEDIHARILRQREVFQIYLPVAEKDIVSMPDSLLDEPISSLMDTLGGVEHEMEALTHKELEVASALAKVKSLHTQVKRKYNNAISHTSVIYPELSQIIALEESYKDQYQHIWEFGMDALTFILDTVTPFWRNYGRTIGEDISDFLIIPWYRNEFTGEAKRYDILSFPRRSVRHWFALFILFWFTVGITFVLFRAAIFCTFIYKLSWIDNSGFRWLIMPSIWSSVTVLWFAVSFQIFIVFLQLWVTAWWLGWLVGLVT